MSRSKSINYQDPKRGKFTEVLEEILAQICKAYIDELKMDPVKARAAAEMALEMFRDSAGGGTLYISKGHLWAVTENHRKIFRRFNGSNHFQLAQEFDISERQIYTIVARCQQEEFNRKQLGLFSENA